MAAIRGVIFDLFHTLTARESEWSSEPPTCDLLGIDRLAWDRILLESSRWRLVGEVREPLEIFTRLARLANPSIGDDAISHVLAVRTRRFADLFSRIPPGNVAALRRMKDAGLRLALLSNADALEASAYAGSALQSLFEVEMFSCDAGFAKPEPEIFHACLAALGLPAAQCVFVGDGGSDELQGAKAVGLRTVLVSGVIEELWPERIAPRAAVADHHVRWVPELLPWLGIDAGEAAHA
jgi:putative hydrolase of the HAD superfamily